MIRLGTRPSALALAQAGLVADRLRTVGREVALVEVRAGATVTADDLLAHCRGLIAEYKCPEELRLVDTLPRDPNGKVRKGDLRRDARAETPPSSPPSPSSSM